jgi:multidrug resistance efflux pump
MVKNIKPILFSTIVPAAFIAICGWYWPFGERTPGLRLPGIVETQEVRLGSKVGGRVAEVRVREGDLLEPGQVLVRFEAPELESQRLQLQARLRCAEADLEKSKNGFRKEEKDAARSGLEAARARWQRLKSGSRPEEIEEAANDLTRADADLKLCRQKYERTRTLNATVTASREEYDSALAAMNRAKAQADAARAHLKLLRAGSRQEDIDEAAAEIHRSQASLELLLTGTRPEDIAAAEARLLEMRARLQEVEVNLEETAVRAPERAVLEVLAVRKGDLVAPNQPILRILRADDLWVKVYIPEPQLGKVQLRQEAEVQLDGYPDKTFHATVIQIASESEFTPRNVQSADERRHQVFAIKVRVANPEGIFKSGMAAEVWIPLPAGRREQP